MFTDEHPLRPKALRWMRTLQRQIRAVWAGQSEDPDAVAIELALAVTAVRVLDLEVFQAAGGSAYSAVRDSGAAGRVVNGMTLVRNAEIHMPVTLTLTSQPIYGASSGPGGTESHFFCTADWQPYDVLPSEVRANTRTAARCHAGYREALQDRPVAETLFDAFCFFAGLAPETVPRDESGKMSGFPLAPGHGDLVKYQRLHPDEPTMADVLDRLRRQVESRDPAGAWREIVHVARAGTEGSVVRLAGFEENEDATSGGRPGVATWADHPELVIGDLRRGYPYWLVDEQGRRRVELRGEDLVVGDEHVLSLNLPGIPHPGERWHIALWHSSDPFHHALMRGIAWWDVVDSGELRGPR